MAFCKFHENAKPDFLPAPVALGLALLLLLLISGSWGAAAKDAAASAKDPCKPGMDLYASGDVLKAIKALDKCLEGNSGSRQAWTALGNANLEAGRFAGAAEAYSHAQKLKAGNAEFLASYLQALEGAGRHTERIAVYRSLLALKPADHKVAEAYLAAVEAEGASRFPDDYANVLENLAANPGADAVFSEKLAASYLDRGLFEKAEAEYRGLLARHPESSDYWAALAASQAADNPEAAAECYRKAALYSSNASERKSCLAAAEKVSKSGSNPQKTVTPEIPAVAAAQPVKSEAGSKASDAEEKQASLAKAEADRKMLAKQLADSAAKAEADRKVVAKAHADSIAKAESDRKVAAALEKKAREEKERLALEEKKRAEKARGDSIAQADKKAKEDAASKAVADAGKAPKPFDVKAFQDSVYKAELEKRMAALRKPGETPSAAAKPAAPVAATKPSPAASAAVPAASASAPAASSVNKDKDEKAAAAKAEADRKVAAAAEKKAQEERERLALEEKKRLEKARGDSLAKVEADRKIAEKKAQEEKERLALEEKKRLEKVRADSLAKAEEDRRVRAEAEKKAREEAERLALLEKQRKEKARADSLARVEEERRAKAEAERKANEERMAGEKQERHDHAIALYKAGRLDSAAALFKRVLSESPDSEACYYGGRAYLDLRQWDKALDLFSKSSSAKPDLDGLKGKALMGMGKDKEALAEFERQYAKTKEDGLLESMVMLKKKTGDEPGAMSYLEKLADARPREARFQEELALYSLKRGDKAIALLRYAKVLAAEPGHGEANYRLGMDWASQGVQDRAVPMLEKAVAAFPNRADAWKALGKGYASLGRRDDAWKACSKALALTPQDVDLAKGKVALAKASGREPELNEAYRDLLRLVPEDADAAMGLAKLRYKAGDWVESEKCFRIACPSSKDGAAWAHYGRALRENKKPNESVAALMKAVELGEGGIPLKQELASSLFETGSVDKADSMAKEMSKRVPSDPEPWFLQGRIAFSRQQVAVAEEHFRKSSRLRPDNGRYAEALAGLLMDKDDYKQALAALIPAEANLSSKGKSMLADCHGAAGDRSKALEIYAQLEKKDPSAQVLSRKMDLLVRMGQGDRAVEAASGSPFADKTEVQFSLAKAQLALAQSHIIKGDLDAAVSLMKKVLGSDEHNAEFHLNLGLAYYLQAKYKKAVGEFSDAMTYRQDYPEALYRKGMCLVKLDRAAEADDFFVELSQHADSSWKARGLYGRALVFESQEKWEAVEHHLMLSIAASPHADALALMSRVCLRQNKLPEAEEWAKRALDIDHSNEEATLALAEALSARKKYPEAIGLAQQALKLRPLSCGLLVQTAKLSFEAGRLDSTLASSGHAMQTCPEEPMGYYYAGMAHHGANKPDEAKRYFKSFRKLGGDAKLIPQ